MDVRATLRIDPGLRSVERPRLYEAFHEATGLTKAAIRYWPASWNEIAADQRYLTTRGFRSFAANPCVSLPEPAPSALPLGEALAIRRSNREFGGAITISEVATLLVESLGCTAVVEDSSADLVHALRAWPSAGGLFPLDAFVLANKVESLPKGLYHFNPITAALYAVPGPSVETIVAEGFFGQESAAEAALHVLLVAAFERTVSKYGDRGYRLVLLDAGHAAQNLLLVAEGLGLNAVPVAGFCDQALNAHLALDGVSDAVVHTTHFGRPK